MQEIHKFFFYISLFSLLTQHSLILKINNILVCYEKSFIKIITIFFMKGEDGDNNRLKMLNQYKSNFFFL